MPDREDDINNRIKELEDKKNELITKVSSLTRRLKYKNYEKLALQPFLQETKYINIGPLRKKKAALEFKISTQAYTPSMEREILKEVKKTEQELNKVYDIEKARRRNRFVAMDIEETEKDIGRIENELKEIREELKRLYEEIRIVRSINKERTKIRSFKDSMPTLGDIVVIDERRKEE